MQKSRYKRCLLIGAVGRQGILLGEVLRELGVDVVKLDDLVPGRTLLDSLKEQANTSDLVICALSASSISPSQTFRQNALFELGYAIGAGRPVLVIASPEVDVPFDLISVPFVRGSANSVTSAAALKPVLGRALQDLRGFHVSEAAEVSHRVGETWARKRLSQLERQLKEGGMHGAEAFELFVAELLEQAGYAVDLRAGPQDEGVDVAAWIDDAEPSISNPLLIQVKGGRTAAADIGRAAMMLTHAMVKVEASQGLIVTQSSIPPSITREALRPFPNVVWIPIEELVNSLIEGAFGKRLIQARNRAVHGD